MRYSEADIQRLLEDTPADFPRREEIRQTLFEKPVPRKATPPRKLLRAVFAASLALCLMFATGFAQAVAQAIEAFVFGDSTIARERNDEGIILRSRLHDRAIPEAFYQGHTASYQRFDTLEEVLAAAPFSFRLPTYLPDGMRPTAFHLEQLDNGTYGYDAFVNLEVPQKGKYFMTLTIYYVGEEGYATMETPYEIETVSVGGIEASLLQDWNQGSATTMLLFKKDGVLYELFSVEYGAEELIRVAESI